MRTEGRADPAKIREPPSLGDSAPTGTGTRWGCCQPKRQLLVAFQFPPVWPPTWYVPDIELPDAVPE